MDYKITAVETNEIAPAIVEVLDYKDAIDDSGEAVKVEWVKRKMSEKQIDDKIAYHTAELAKYKEAKSVFAIK
jgi:hypothetical protein